MTVQLCKTLKSGYGFGVDRSAVADQLQKIIDEIRKDSPAIAIHSAQMCESASLADYQQTELYISFTRKIDASDGGVPLPGNDQFPIDVTKPEE